MGVATSLPVTFSMPSKPGEELISRSSGPLFEGTISTPATCSPWALVAATARLMVSLSGVIGTAVPPKCRFERNSPCVAACRSMAATHLSPTIIKRQSLPADSEMNS